MVNMDVTAKNSWQNIVNIIIIQVRKPRGTGINYCFTHLIDE